MTIPLHARTITGRGRWYGNCGKDGCPLGDELYISVTNAQDVISKPALAPAAAKATAEAAWQRLPRMVATSRQAPTGTCSTLRVADRCGVCRFCVTAAIKTEYRQTWEARADLGTRVHAAAAANAIGTAPDDDPDVAPFLTQYLRWLETWSIDIDRHIEAVETTVIDRKHAYAGTGDLWVHLPLAGNRRVLTLVDIKTSLTKPETAIYRDQELQLAGLRYAPSTVLADDTEITTPKFGATAILNLRADTHALILVPAEKPAHRAFLAAATLQRHFNDGQDLKTWVPETPPVPPDTGKA